MARICYQYGYGLLWLIPIALIVQYFWLVVSFRWTVVTGRGRVRFKQVIEYLEKAYG